MIVITINCYFNHPNKVFWKNSYVLLVSLICHTHIVIRGQHVNLSSFSRWNVRNNRSWRVRLGNIRASARLMVAFSGFYESHEPPPSSDAWGIVPSHREGHKNGQQSGYMFHHCWVDCCSGGRLSDMEQVVARWRHPVASGEALVMLHQAMPHVLLQCLGMPIKMAWL